jgi:hypothetical protein
MLDTSTDFVSTLSHPAWGSTSPSSDGGSGQGPNCSIPCDEAGVAIRFNGCCFLVSSECDITIVGDGTITGPTGTGGPPECGPMQVIVTTSESGQGEYLPIDVSDGDIIRIEVRSSEPCCNCHLAEITCPGTLRLSGAIWSLSNGKLRLNKRKYLAQRNHIIRYRVSQKLKKMRKNRNTN